MFWEYHFNGNFKNASDVKNALQDLSKTKLASLVEKDKNSSFTSF